MRHRLQAKADSFTCVPSPHPPAVVFTSGIVLVSNISVAFDRKINSKRLYYFIQLITRGKTSLPWAQKNASRMWFLSISKLISAFLCVCQFHSQVTPPDKRITAASIQDSNFKSDRKKKLVSFPDNLNKESLIRVSLVCSLPQFGDVPAHV